MAGFGSPHAATSAPAPDPATVPGLAVSPSGAAEQATATAASAVTPTNASPVTTSRAS
jgi:hypothetical protein